MLNIHHKAGGQVTAVIAIAHRTYRDRATWHFIGKVRWDDGAGDPDKLYEISPVNLCLPESGDETDYSKAQTALEEYLRINGDWVNHDWRPHAPEGRAEVNL